MKLGIDITSLIYQRGVSRYTANLVRSLAELDEVELSLYGYSLRKKNRLEQMGRNLIGPQPRHQVTIQGIPQSIQAWLWRLGLNSVKKTLPQIDLFHSWDWLQPPDKNLPLVSTIHDLAILKYPDTAHPKILAAHKRSWEILKKRQAHLIAVSQATKKDLVELLQIPPWRVHVIPEALPEELRLVNEALTEEETEKIKSRLNLTQPYLLFVGTREPRKNLVRLIKAWEPLSQDFQLLVAGESGWDQTDKLDDQYDQLRFLGRVSEKELNVLYAEANAFAYPSLYEGFGLPILEAFYHGTPVLTSNLSAMIEVAGNAAVLVDPTSIEDMAQGLKTLLTEDLEQQQKRLQRMIIRLQMFNWQKVARDTLKVYQQALSEFEQEEIK